jgi:indolepyruvate ferredoxin oxidoreductase beta subunit
LDEIEKRLRQVTENIKSIDAKSLAAKAGNPRTENIVLLGAASKVDGFPVSRDQLIEAIKTIVPQRTIEENIKAFNLGEEI